MAWVCLQYIHVEETYVRQWLDSKEITYYGRYVDDILIIYKTKVKQMSRQSYI